MPCVSSVPFLEPPHVIIPHNQSMLQDMHSRSILQDFTEFSPFLRDYYEILLKSHKIPVKSHVYPVKTGEGLTTTGGF